MKNIHVLLTDKDKLDFPFIAKNCFNNNYTIVDSTFKDNCELAGMNIYITSDEEIVRDDYVTDGIEIIKASLKLIDSQGLLGRRNWRKIILTTDVNLIKDNVQAIDDEFLEWFIKNPSCEEVEFENEKYILQHLFKPQEYRFRYKIIIPKIKPKQKEKQETLEEAQKQQFKYDNLHDAKEISSRIKVVETLEEAAENHSNEMFSKNGDLNSIAHTSFIKGTKWQQERSYSEEDMKQFGLYLGNNFALVKGKSIDELFEQFKKK